MYRSYENSAKTVDRLIHGVIGRPGTWLLIALFLLITFFEYAEQLEHFTILGNLTANLGLTRYTVERILYLFPIVWAGFLFGWRGGAIVSLAAVVSMLPRALFESPVPEDALIETGAVFIIGNLVSYSLESLRKERQRRAQLETAQGDLQHHLNIIEADEKRLAALNQTSSIISQSLEVTEVLDSAVDSVVGMMGVEAVRIYILDESAGELTLASYWGISEEFVKEVSKIKIGEGYNGRVAQTGEPLYVEDASIDNSTMRAAVKKENIRSQLAVPLISKGKVLGSLCVAMHSYRFFTPAEVDLLAAISNQIGVAVENARLYERQRQAVEQLSALEQRYRELFENAHDAIWLHDLEGNIIAANRACVKLTGYSLEELRSLKAIELLSEESLETTANIQRRLLNGDALGSLGEVKLVKSDGTEAIVQLASSLVFSSGQPAAVQHIARDVTQQKHMHENLRLFLQQVTRAQEEERKRIARELHDDTIQSLVSHCQQIDDVASGVKRLQMQAQLRLDGLHQEVNNIMQGVWRVSQDLRPATLDNLGLLSALEWLASDVTKYSGIAIELKVLGIKRRLPDEVELVLFRIAQEALRNVWKHAQATSAEIKLEFTEMKTSITISDNGKGFEAPLVVGDLPRYGKLGLAGMQERARLLGGTLTVRSDLSKGTSLIVELPVSAHGLLKLA